MDKLAVTIILSVAALLLGGVLAWCADRVVERLRGRSLCHGARDVLWTLTSAVALGLLLLLIEADAGRAAAGASNALMNLLILDVALALGRWQARRDAGAAECPRSS